MSTLSGTGGDGRRGERLRLTDPEAASILELRERRRRTVYDGYADAAADPEFLEDMAAVTEAFELVAADGLP